jgi:hypothetical protein
MYGRMNSAKSVVLVLYILVATILVVPQVSLASEVFEGLGFNSHWEYDDCIAVTSAGMTISCPQSVEFAIGCYARIGDQQLNRVTRLIVEIEFDSYSFLQIYDDCGCFLDFQPQFNHGYTSFIVNYYCTGQNIRSGENVGWSVGLQKWVFDITNISVPGGGHIRRLITTTPSGTAYQNEVLMNPYYPLSGEISFYFGADKGHLATIKRVEFFGEGIIATATRSWGSIKALYK